MGLKPGMTNNKKGRKPGIPNKIPFDVKKRLSEGVDKEFIASLFEDITYIDSPKDRAWAKLKLLEYIVPKPKDPVEADKEDDFRERFIEALQLKK